MIGAEQTDAIVQAFPAQHEVWTLHLSSSRAARCDCGLCDFAANRIPELVYVQPGDGVVSVLTNHVGHAFGFRRFPGRFVVPCYAARCLDEAEAPPPLDFGSMLPAKKKGAL